MSRNDHCTFAAIYQGYLKPGREEEYQKLWKIIATYFIEKRGALGSCLHKTAAGLWVAYSRWPDQVTREASWPGENAPSQELPIGIREAIVNIKDCMDQTQKIPDLSLELVCDLTTVRGHS